MHIPLDKTAKVRYNKNGNPGFQEVSIKKMMKVCAGFTNFLFCCEKLLTNSCETVIIMLGIQKLRNFFEQI